MTGLRRLFSIAIVICRIRNLKEVASDPSWTVRKIRLLALKYLRNVKSVLALHFRLGRLSLEFPQRRRYRHPVARTACEACAESLLRIRATNSIYVFRGWKINFAELPDGIHK